MSFSSECKDSITGCDTMRECCKRSMLMGMLVYASIYTKDKIKFITENKSAADLLIRLFEDLYGIKCNLYTSEKKTPPEGEESGKKAYESFKITVPDKKEVAKMSLLFVPGTSLYHINPDVFSCVGCKAAFARGVFIAAGNVTDPQRSYHLEISCAYRNLAFETLALLKELSIEPKITVRKSSYVLYYKKTETIIDFLNTIGAKKSAFDYINLTIEKENINSVNRAVNCDTANIQKSVMAATEAIEAITYLIESGNIEKMPSELYSAALLRIENPELTLAQLAEISSDGISKSGMNHRLKKIIAFALQCKNES